MSEYTLVFDLVQTGYRLWSAALGPLIFVVAGLALVLLRNRFRTPAHVLIIGLVFVAFALPVTLLVQGGAYLHYNFLSSALHEGRVSVVEGAVADYASPKNGFERYSVQGVTFQYSDDELTPAFNNTESRGGPIHPGLQVRITYVDDDPFAGGTDNRSIVRLEIRE